MNERDPVGAEDGGIRPGEPDGDASVRGDAGEGPDDPMGEAGEAVADPYNLRLTALLHQLVRKRGHKGAARALGIDRRTVAASVREGLSRRVRDALERTLVEKDGDARDKLGEDFEEFRERCEAWAQELRDGLQAVQGQVEALGQQEGERMRRLEGRLALVEAGPDGSPADRGEAGGQRPRARAAAHRRYPDLVTKDPADDDEGVFGEVWPLVQEWRTLWAGHPPLGQGWAWVSTRERILELEVALLEERGMTLPPETEPFRGLDRGGQLHWRRKALADMRGQRARLELRRWLRRALTLGLWRR